jgi:hypothetical protein
MVQQSNNDPWHTQHSYERTRTWRTGSINPVNLSQCQVIHETDIYLVGEGARGGQGVADEVAGGDVRDAEQLREAAGVGALPHPGAPEEHPLHAPPVLLIPPPAPGRRRPHPRPRPRRLLRQRRPRSSGQGSPGRGGEGADRARHPRHLAGSAQLGTSRAAEIFLGFFFLLSCVRDLRVACFEFDFESSTRTREKEREEGRGYIHVL